MNESNEMNVQNSHSANEELSVAFAVIALQDAMNRGETVNSGGEIAITSITDDIQSLLLDIHQEDYNSRAHTIDQCVTKLFFMGVIGRARAIYSASYTKQQKRIATELSVARSAEVRERLANESRELAEENDRKTALLKRLSGSL